MYSVKRRHMGLLLHCYLAFLLPPAFISDSLPPTTKPSGRFQLQLKCLDLQLQRQIRGQTWRRSVRASDLAVGPALCFSSSHQSAFAVIRQVLSIVLFAVGCITTADAAGWLKLYRVTYPGFQVTVRCISGFLSTLCSGPRCARGTTCCSCRGLLSSSLIARSWPA